jgi:hypothetical protein
MSSTVSDAAWYVCIARLDGDERSFMWQGEDPGPARVVVDPGGFVLSFGSVATLYEMATSNGWNVSDEEPTFYDLDAVAAWCKSDASLKDPSPLLNAWNLFVDLPRGEGLFSAADSRALGLYDVTVQGFGNLDHLDRL